MKKQTNNQAVGQGFGTVRLTNIIGNSKGCRSAKERRLIKSVMGSEWTSPDLTKHLAELRKGCGDAIFGGTCGRLNSPIKPKRYYCPDCQAKLQEAQVMLKFMEQELKEDVEFLSNIEYADFKNSLRGVELAERINKKVEQKQAQLKLIKEEVSR